MQLRAYTGSLASDVKSQRTPVLVTQLLNWAAESRQVHAVIRLPLDGLEQQVWDAVTTLLLHTKV